MRSADALERPEAQTISKMIEGKTVIRALAIVLTSQCNLRCAYCFENAKNGQSMRWKTLRAALDVGLRHGGPGLKILFTGGEPLLEYPLIRRAAAYVRDHRRPGKRARFSLLTNGTLLDEEKIEFLAANSFRLQLSFDGVKKAQDQRGRRTFAQLDRLLGVMSERHAPFFRNRLTISMIITPRTVRYMADSVEYFLSRGVRKVALAPTIADCSDWRVDRVGELGVQFARIERSSLSHLNRTGRVPLKLFQGWEDPGSLLRVGRVPDGGRREPMCRAARGGVLSVDPDGEVSACVTLSGSYQRFKSDLLRKHAGLMRIGNIRSGDFMDLHASFPGKARRARMFCGKGGKYSSYRACSDCDYLAGCALCPVSIGHIPGNRDPNRVPDFYCAFNFASLRHREQFLSRALFGEPVVRQPWRY